MLLIGIHKALRGRIRGRGGGAATLCSENAITWETSYLSHSSYMFATKMYSSQLSFITVLSFISVLVAPNKIHEGM